MRQRGMLNLVGQMKGSQAPVLGMVLILRKQRIEVASLFLQQPRKVSRMGFIFDF